MYNLILIYKENSVSTCSFASFCSGAHEAILLDVSSDFGQFGVARHRCLLVNIYLNTRGKWSQRYLVEWIITFYFLWHVNFIKLENLCIPAIGVMRFYKNSATSSHNTVLFKESWTPTPLLAFCSKLSKSF